MRRPLPALAVLLASSFSLPAAPTVPSEVVVYKTRTCGCCKKWVAHMENAGFKVTVHEVESTSEAQRTNGVPDALRSCHTATVAGYTLEGHIPATDVQRLLASKPKAKGIAVPGMPAGSPGMEAPHRDGFNVMLFTADGKSTVFQKYAAE